MKRIFNVPATVCCVLISVVYAKKYAEQSYKKGYDCGYARCSFIEVNKREASQIIGNPMYSPKGKFWLHEDGAYVGIDNHTHDAWTEEFKTKEECFNWLEGKVEVE